MRSREYEWMTRNYLWAEATQVIQAIRENEWLVNPQSAKRKVILDRGLDSGAREVTQTRLYI